MTSGVMKNRKETDSLDSNIRNQSKYR